MRRLFAAFLFGVLGLLAGAGSAVAQSPLAQSPLVLSASPLPFNPEDKTQETAGGLIWRGGLAITSDDPRFGGLSDLVLAPDGSSVTAISDAGRWVTARLTYDSAGKLAGITGGSSGSLRDTRGLLLVGKRTQDAEALARLDDGSLVIAFERNHRFLRFGKDGLGGVPKALSVPAGLAGAGANAGVEALVALAGNRLLAFTEGQKIGDSYAVYLREADGRWHALALRPKGLFLPTGAAQLPNGDVLLLERRFTVLGGLGARLSRIPLAAIRPGALLAGHEIAELRAPLSLDNFEGVAVHRLGNGATRITLISDDNFSPLHRTLIVQFELAGGD